MSERDEMRDQAAKMEEKIGQVRGEIQRIAQGARSAYFLAVMPNGEMVNLCFHAGYVDLRGMQIESAERLAEIINAGAKRLPSQAV